MAPSSSSRPRPSPTRRSSACSASSRTGACSVRRSCSLTSRRSSMCSRASHDRASSPPPHVLRVQLLLRLPGRDQRRPVRRPDPRAQRDARGRGRDRRRALHRLLRARPQVLPPPHARVPRPRRGRGHDDHRVGCWLVVAGHVHARGHGGRGWGREPHQLQGQQLCRQGRAVLLL